jgi:hypothetical protein
MPELALACFGCIRRRFQSAATPRRHYRNIFQTFISRVWPVQIGCVDPPKGSTPGWQRSHLELLNSHEGQRWWDAGNMIAQLGTMQFVRIMFFVISLPKTAEMRNQRVSRGGVIARRRHGHTPGQRCLKPQGAASASHTRTGKAVPRRPSNLRHRNLLTHRQDPSCQLHCRLPVAFTQRLDPHDGQMQSIGRQACDHSIRIGCRTVE